MNVTGATPPHANGSAILCSGVRLALPDALGADAVRMGFDVAGGTVALAGHVLLPGTNARGFMP